MYIELSDYINSKCNDFGERVVAAGLTDATAAETMEEVKELRDDPVGFWARNKKAESAVCVAAGGDPVEDLGWEAVPDNGYDLIWSEKRVDAKRLQPWHSKLIWPLSKNHRFLECPIDVLIPVKLASPGWVINWWIKASDFYERKLEAKEGDGTKLIPGTWYMPLSKLGRIE
jgi:hypothetical protein